MVKLTKAIIKKYGISKKAWSVARGKTKSKSRVRKASSGGNKMARKRRSVKRKSYSRSGKMSMQSIKKIAIGVGGVILYEIFVSPMIPLAEMTKNIVELLVGIVLMVSPKVPPVLRAVGGAMATINLFQLASPVVRGWLQGGQSADQITY